MLIPIPVLIWALAVVTAIALIPAALALQHWWEDRRDPPPARDIPDSYTRLLTDAPEHPLYEPPRLGLTRYGDAFDRNTDPTQRFPLATHDANAKEATTR